MYKFHAHGFVECFDICNKKLMLGSAGFIVFLQILCYYKSIRYISMFEFLMSIIILEKNVGTKVAPFYMMFFIYLT